MKIVLFRGYRGSGKTWALTCVTRALVEAKCGKVGTIKGIHERSFTIDSKGKDTWLHSSAGASIVAAFAPNEVDIIKRGNTTSSSLTELLGIFEKSKIDFLLVEGLHRKFEDWNQTEVVICARTEQEARRLVRKNRGNILFVTGKFAKHYGEGRIGHSPVLSLPRDVDSALDLISGNH